MSERKVKKNEPQSVILPLVDNDNENILVSKIDKGQYEVLTIPFWAYNLSMGDIVRCLPDEDGLGLFIEKVVRKSGNRTVRVMFKHSSGNNHPEAISLRTYLDEHGLKYELYPVRLTSINVPSEDAYQDLIERLNAITEEAEMQWELADPEPSKNLDTSDVSSSIMASE